jgi:hypothetical protein
MARDLQPLLGYTSWENFANVIEKAKMACESAGVDAGGQFHEVTKGIAAGKGAEVQRTDMFLSRYACYVIAMNGDPRKTEVGLAQAYFAVQTRRQEIRDQNPELRRLEMRQRVKEANRSLTSAATRHRVLRLAAGGVWRAGRCASHTQPGRPGRCRHQQRRLAELCGLERRHGAAGQRGAHVLDRLRRPRRDVSGPGGDARDWRDRSD